MLVGSPPWSGWCFRSHWAASFLDVKPALHIIGRHSFGPTDLIDSYLFWAEELFRLDLDLLCLDLLCLDLLCLDEAFLGKAGLSEGVLGKAGLSEAVLGEATLGEATLGKAAGEGVLDETGLGSDEFDHEDLGGARDLGTAAAGASPRW